MRAEVFYWHAHNPEVFEASNFPVFIHQKEAKHYVYGLPIFEYPGLMKVSITMFSLIIMYVVLVIKGVSMLVKDSQVFISFLALLLLYGEVWLKYIP